MTAAALLAELRNRGAALAVVGDKLRVEAPVGTITPEIREALARHKATLLAMLSSDSELCEHVAYDPELAEWYRENPHLTCARCFFAGRPLRAMLQ
jgi:pyochelin synthetase